MNAVFTVLVFWYTPTNTTTLFVQVRRALQAMGVAVVSADAAGVLPPVARVAGSAGAAPLAPPPHAALLDVSALLALIS